MFFSDCVLFLIVYGNIRSLCSWLGCHTVIGIRHTLLVCPYFFGILLCCGVRHFLRICTVHTFGISCTVFQFLSFLGGFDIDNAVLNSLNFIYVFIMSPCQQSTCLVGLLWFYLYMLLQLKILFHYWGLNKTIQYNKFKRNNKSRNCRLLKSKIQNWDITLIFDSSFKQTWRSWTSLERDLIFCF